ncbi:N-acyl-D-amino-acid deacylase family protein [Clostridium sp. Cult2]|uniref:N-acyl-D-amino-acid deacylase family protein n=1 Tax=Clostridium sp. Cult2 TaxID=2079003 RepID=UPI001F3AF526|nr:amidohydrolase family protein [Clostridium sp. Cult2]
MVDFDIIIRNGKVIDGTGKDSYIADIGIKDGVIVKIGDLKDNNANKVINSEGKSITPGFIDMHSHGDDTLLIYPKMESKIMQGITTIVGGQCGLSPAPIDKYWITKYYEIDILDEIEPYIYSPERMYPIEKIKGKLKEVYGLDVNWKTFGEFLDKVEEKGISANYIPLVGHGQIRGQVMGRDCKRFATDEELKKIKEYVREAMESGAYGISVGLDYAPGIYCNFEELLEIAKEIKKYDGIYAAHWRKTGLRVGTPKKQKKIDGIIEILEIGKQADVQVQLSHLSSGFDVFPSKNDFMMKSAAKATLQVIDEYLKDGVKAAFDVIPNIVCGIILIPNLSAIFTPWIKQSGSLKQFINNLKVKDYKIQLIEMINSGKFHSINPVVSPDWDEFITIIESKNKNYINKSIKEIAEINKKSSVEIIFDLLIEDPNVKVYSISQKMNMEIVKEFLRHSQATLSTDTFALDIKGPWNSLDEKHGFAPTPNTYCAMVKYIKELGMERIEDTIRKATGKTAEVLGLNDRGFIKEGYKADVLIIDMDNLKTNENYIEPRVFPEGIEYVLVNGKIVVEEGNHTGNLAGKVIRKSL